MVRFKQKDDYILVCLKYGQSSFLAFIAFPDVQAKVSDMPN